MYHLNKNKYIYTYYQSQSLSVKVHKIKLLLQKGCVLALESKITGKLIHMVLASHYMDTINTSLTSLVSIGNGYVFPLGKLWAGAL